METYLVGETKTVLITGKPGCGKTTLLRRAIAESGVNAGGFYTEEIRERGRRLGFRIVTLEGRTAVLSHVSIRSPHMVGRYGVDLRALEEVGVPAIHAAVACCQLVVIDEIGRMELFSPSFREAVLKALESAKKVLATIMLASSSFTDGLKSRTDVSVVTLDRTNWERVLSEVVLWLRGSKLR